MPCTSVRLCLVFFGVFVGCWIGPTAAQAPYVTAEPALRPVILTGFTRARKSLPVASEISGRVLEVAVDVGDTIDGSNVFARIDDTFVRLELEQVQVRQTRLRTKIEFDAREVERYERLARQNNAAAAQLDAFKQTLDDNRNALLELGVEERILNERLARTTVSAPSGWQVTGRLVEPGQWVNAGDPMGRVADFTTLTVPFALTTEQYAALSAQAQRPRGIQLRLSELDKHVQASLLWTNPAFDPDTRKVAIELEIEVDDTSDALPRRGGVRAELTLDVPELSGAVVLPETAVRSSYEEYWVDPLDGDPIAVLLLGRTSNGDGLRVVGPHVAPGDRFLTRD